MCVSLVTNLSLKQLDKKNKPVSVSDDFILENYNRKLGVFYSYLDNGKRSGLVERREKKKKKSA